MPIQDFATALEECRVCLTKCKGELDGLLTLVEQAPQFTAAAFAQSVSDRMPELQRTSRASLARISIFIQVMKEMESEKQAQNLSFGAWEPFDSGATKKPGLKDVDPGA